MPLSPPFKADFWIHDLAPRGLLNMEIRGFDSTDDELIAHRGEVVTDRDSTKMTVPPHSFQTLRKAGKPPFRPSILVMGAGMSYGIAPLPPVLLAEKKNDAERRLQMTSTEETCLYAWADQICECLRTKGRENPKLDLAEAMGLIHETRWWGASNSEQTTPRHRIVARFAREGLWEQIWSYNWDCVQEAALESVGIKRGADSRLTTWPTSFETFITASDCIKTAYEGVIKVLKPHGCVQALSKAREASDAGDTITAHKLAERFRITKSELDSVGKSPDSTDEFIFSSMCVAFSSHPLVIAGWSASEPYLIEYLERTLAPIFACRPNPDDELSILDITFNEQGHRRLAALYGSDEGRAHFRLDQARTMNNLMLWAQGLYGLQHIAKHCEGGPKNTINQLLEELESTPEVNAEVLLWVDRFLPAWVRLCWRSGVVECRKQDGTPVIPEDISLESKDEHVPWNVPNISRPDLATAGILLHQMVFSGHLKDWNPARFPGAFFREMDAKLVIPIPAWDVGTINNLRGLKPLLDDFQSSGAGFIDSIDILLLGQGSTFTSVDRVKLKKMVASLLRHVHFSKVENLGDFDLNQL